MLIKRVELIEINDIIMKLKTATFNIKTQYKFMKIGKKIEEELSILKEQTQILVEKYGENVDKEGYIRIKSDCLEQCEKQIEEINNFEVQLPDIYFSLDELENLGLTLGELSLLEPFIK